MTPATPTAVDPATATRARGERVIGALRRLHDRFGTDTVIPPSRVRAAAFLLAGLAVSAIAVSV